MRRVKKNIEATEKLFRLIDSTGDEPVIKGTDISAYRIAALHEGMEVEGIMQDYPSVSRRQILAAKAYSASHPKPGRPYPTTTVKKTMREARSDAAPFLPTRG